MIHETHNNFSETKQEILSFESVNLHDKFLIKKKSLNLYGLNTFEEFDA
jgi:hypothetical protein